MSMPNSSLQQSLFYWAVLHWAVDEKMNVIVDRCASNFCGPISKTAEPTCVGVCYEMKRHPQHGKHANRTCSTSRTYVDVSRGAGTAQIVAVFNVYNDIGRGSIAVAEGLVNAGRSFSIFLKASHQHPQTRPFTSVFLHTSYFSYGVSPGENLCLLLRKTRITHNYSTLTAHSGSSPSPPPKHPGTATSFRTQEKLAPPPGGGQSFETTVQSRSK